MDAEGKKAFDAAELDSLDYEIRLAKANLDAAVKRWSENPTGGIVQSHGDKVIRERLYVDIVREHLEAVRRLVEARAKLLGGDPADTSQGAIVALVAGLQSKLDTEDE